MMDVKTAADNIERALKFRITGTKEEHEILEKSLAVLVKAASYTPPVASDK